MLKQKTKKIGIALLISVMVFALCSCGGNTESEGSSELVIGTYSEGSDCVMDPQMTSSYGDWQYVNQMSVSYTHLRVKYLALSASREAGKVYLQCLLCS